MTNKLQQSKNLYGKYRMIFFSYGIFETDIGQERIIFECFYLIKYTSNRRISFQIQI